jgi:uncharacterized lipoprotein YajG
MKKLFVIVAASALIFSCSSKEEDTTEETSNPAGIQNVNGNIPDTTNSIDLSTSKKDSVVAGDSLKK